MMVIEKATKRLVNVCDIRYDKNGYPNFLYYQDGQWLQKSAKYFSPNIETDCDNGGEHHIINDEPYY